MKILFDSLFRFSINSISTTGKKYDRNETCLRRCDYNDDAKQALIWEISVIFWKGQMQQLQLRLQFRHLPLKGVEI